MDTHTITQTDTHWGMAVTLLTVSLRTSRATRPRVLVRVRIRIPHGPDTISNRRSEAGGKSGAVYRR